MSRTRSFTRSGALNIACQIGLLGLFYLVGREVPLGAEGALRYLFLSGIVLIPSVIWTVFFYLQDRNEPEPIGFTLVSLLAGMAAASLLAVPLQQVLLQTDGWMHLSGGHLAAGAFLVFGAVPAFLFYAILRYGFYPTVEFDEPVDGMIYGAFLGCGFALVQSLVYLGAHPEFTLFTIVYTASTNILVYSSAAALVGYFMGRAKFTPATTHGAGLQAVVLATLLLGVYHVANEFIFIGGFEHAFWGSIFLTFCFAAAVLTAAAMGIRQLTKPETHVLMDGRRGLEPLPALFVVLCIAGAAFVGAGIDAGGRFAHERYDVTFRYPADYVASAPSAARQVVLTAPPAPLGTVSSPGSTSLPVSLSGTTSLLGGGAARRVGFQPEQLFSAGGTREGLYNVSLRVLDAPTDLSSFDPAVFTGVEEALRVRTRAVVVAGQTGLRIQYGYVDKENAGDVFPVMLWAVTDVVPVGEQTFAFTFRATPARFADEFARYERLLETVAFPTR